LGGLTLIEAPEVRTLGVAASLGLQSGNVIFHIAQMWPRRPDGVASTKVSKSENIEIMPKLHPELDTNRMQPFRELSLTGD
jgi:hypothetical protein